MGKEGELRKGQIRGMQDRKLEVKPVPIVLERTDLANQAFQQATQLPPREYSQAELDRITLSGNEEMAQWRQILDEHTRRKNGRG